MNLDLSPAFARAQALVNGAVAAIPSLIVALVVFGVFLLLVTQPFRIGDQIVASSYEGTVEDIQTRATFIRTYDGRRVVVPNADLFTDTVVVNTAFPHRRIEYDVGIGYSDDVERARGVILETVRGIEGVLAEPPPDVLLMDFASSAVSLRVRWWIAPPKRADALDSRDKVLTAIKTQLAEHGIDLPFPTQQVLFHDQTEEGDGDRARQREGWPAGSSEVPASRRAADLRRMPAPTEGPVPLGPPPSG